MIIAVLVIGSLIGFIIYASIIILICFDEMIKLIKDKKEDSYELQ